MKTPVMTIVMQTIVFWLLLLSSAHSLLVSTNRNLKINNAIKPYNRYTESTTSVYMSTDLNNVKDLVLTEKKSLSRSELNEYILQLEKLNPTEDPALSPLLNGVWEVISSGLFSPGFIGVQIIKSLPGPKILDVEDITITISSEFPRVVASSSVKLFNAKVPVSITTDIEIESSYRIKETYINGKISSVEIPLNSIRKFSRNVVISYLDNDLLIARDKFGAPEILKRKAFEGNKELDP